MRKLTILIAIATLSVTAVARADDRPDSESQPLLDGCRRSTGEVLVGTAPEWTYTYSDPAPRTLVGTVAWSRTAGDDNPFTHDSYDWNADVVPDPGYGFLAATANDGGAVHVEWEEAAFPFWAWPTANDRVNVLGAWIWDCGHWGAAQDPREDPMAWIPYAGTRGVRGEGTEIHPPRAVFTLRDNAAEPGGVVQRADLFISSNGTQARIQEQCPISAGIDPATGRVSTDHLTQKADGASSGCSAWQPVNDRDYTYSIPAPPGSGPVTFEVTRLEKQNAPDPIITVVGDEVRVHVPFAGYGEPTASLQQVPMSLGLSVVARRATPAPAAGVRVRIDSVTVNTELDRESFGGDAYTSPPDEYAIYADVAGAWSALHAINPDLLRAVPGSTYPIGSSRDVWLPAGSALPLRTFARECDLPRMAPCGTLAEFGFGEDPGSIALVSDILSAPVGTVRADTITSSGCGCYTLSLTLERIG